MPTPDEKKVKFPDSGKLSRRVHVQLKKGSFRVILTCTQLRVRQLNLLHITDN